MTEEHNWVEKEMGLGYRLNASTYVTLDLSFILHIFYFCKDF